MGWGPDPAHGSHPASQPASQSRPASGCSVVGCGKCALQFAIWRACQGHSFKSQVSIFRKFQELPQRPFEPRDKISYPWLQSADESSSSAVRSSARERLLCSGLWAARPGLAAAGDTHAGTEALGAPVDPKGGKPVRAKPVERVADIITPALNKEDNNKILKKGDHR